MARPTEASRKHGLRNGLRDRSELNLSVLHAEILGDNHEFIRAVAKAKGMSVGAFLDKWISSKREKVEALYKTSNNPVNSSK